MSATISACLIVRDEAKRLARCLESLRGVVDEIVVIDTGSNDDTIAIAESFGAKVGHFSWVDDFSKARNAALDLATSDWVLSIDADEWLSNAGAVAGAVAVADAIAYRVTLINHLDQGRKEPESLTRLFRRHAGIRFEGRIHEQVTESVATLVAGGGGRWLPLDALVIEHDGYLEAIKDEKSKRARNIALLERALAEKPNDTYLRYKLATELGPGCDHFRIVGAELGAAPSAWLRLRPWTHAALINCALTSADGAAVEGLVSACEAAFGAHPALALALAKARAVAGDAAGTLQAVANASGDRHVGPAFDRAQLDLELGLLTTAAHRALAQYDKALATLAELRTTHPDSPRPIYGLIELALELDDVRSALELGLGRLREAPGDCVALELCARVADKVGDREVAERWRAAAAGV
jgi:tetratricopeptide (TPR) repeat protein